MNRCVILNNAGFFLNDAECFERFFLLLFKIFIVYLILFFLTS